ncbi:MAG: helix-turn-helix transcriptional regulator [Clostridia bacterium]|nr:helix-turn-helix transcriptional regulator [Clostridia bacterium]MBR2175780.1 helix-turn-helix transcriptional regulator [Clostridia bacterium]
MVEGEEITTTGIFINSDVLHTVNSENGDILIALIDSTTAEGQFIERNYLQGRPYIIADKELCDDIRNVFYNTQPKNLSFAFFQCIYRNENILMPKEIDDRVQTVLIYLEEIPAIPQDIMQQLCRKTYLSQSRLSHLFSENMGISLHRYLAFAKIKKAAVYHSSGMSLTEAAVTGGFHSSTHLSAAMQRMFGISISAFEKSAAK